MKYTVLITTYNRAAYLRDTLRDLARQTTSEPWELIVVDNNSADDTQAVVHEESRAFPAELRYLFEGVQGKPAALNTGIAAARGAIIVFIDDDMRADPEWLTRIGEAFERLQCDYVGGKVLPIWEGTRPAWLADKVSRQWGVIGVADYGSTALPFTTRGLPPPMGGNMACRLHTFEQAGMWDNRFGRHGRTLRGQEQREWHLRAVAAGLKGYYVPELVTYHLIPAARLTKRYFRRWFYWSGISRALLYDKLGIDMDAPDDSRLDFSKVPHIAGVPRYMFRTALNTTVRLVLKTIKRDQVAAFDDELWLWFFAGVVRQRWADRRRPPQFISRGAAGPSGPSTIAPSRA
jgi:glycosyltransferase involved in cell wall biosynthesis